MTDQDYIVALKRALADVITNLSEDVPKHQWSKHLRAAVADAIELLLPQE